MQQRRFIQSQIDNGSITHQLVKEAEYTEDGVALCKTAKDFLDFFVENTTGCTDAALSFERTLMNNLSVYLKDLSNEIEDPIGLRSKVIWHLRAGYAVLFLFELIQKRIYQETGLEKKLETEFQLKMERLFELLLLHLLIPTNKNEVWEENLKRCITDILEAVEATSGQTLKTTEYSLNLLNGCLPLWVEEFLAGKAEEWYVLVKENNLVLRSWEYDPPFVLLGDMLLADCAITDYAEINPQLKNEPPTFSAYNFLILMGSYLQSLTSAFVSICKTCSSSFFKPSKNDKYANIHSTESEDDESGIDKEDKLLIKSHLAEIRVYSESDGQQASASRTTAPTKSA